MKATGVVRRIDDLGRVVIPKEIRRTLRIREGDPLEIYTDPEGGIVLKKYSTMNDMKEFAKVYVDALAQTTGNTVAVTDREHFIAVSRVGTKDLLGKRLTKRLEKAIDERKSVLYGDGQGEYMPLVEGENSYLNEAISPIIAEGNALGAVILVSRKDHEVFSETEHKLTQTAATFLGKHLEM